MTTIVDPLPSLGNIGEERRGIDAEAERVADAAVAHALEVAATRPPVMVVQAVAGAGKTQFVAELAVQRARSGESVIVATCTREQAAEVCERLAVIGVNVQYTQGAGSAVPERVLKLGASVSVVTEGKVIAPTPGVVVVGNIAKLAYLPVSVAAFDVMVVDEGFQLRAAEFLPAHTLAKRWVLVGDPAQLAPFTPEARPGVAPSPAVVSAAASVLTRHPGVPVVDLPVSRRLPASTAEWVGKAFYPGMNARSLTAPGARKLVATPATPSVLRALGSGSIALAELPGPCTHGVDLALAEEAVELAMGALGQVVLDENGARCLGPEDVVVLAGRHAEVGMLRRSLHGTGIEATTFNRAQGRTFDVTIVLDPLVASSPLDEFSLDVGRLAVALTRHRIGVVLMSRRGLRETLRHELAPRPPDVLVGTDRLERAVWLHTALRGLASEVSDVAAG